MLRTFSALWTLFPHPRSRGGGKKNKVPLGNEELKEPFPSLGLLGRGRAVPRNGWANVGMSGKHNPIPSCASGCATPAQLRGLQTAVEVHRGIWESQMLWPQVDLSVPIMSPPTIVCDPTSPLPGNP